MSFQVSLVSTGLDGACSSKTIEAHPLFFKRSRIPEEI